ncbi:glycine betaine ABC transporter substrate-binding protein [Pseudomonas gingeri]|uniref:glycine betaine ABC transporter substrate-binding protein n=1 Tax=Pseudomonas gingeri TaxID=117681 RepID=UPI0015A0AD2D|nr:glycine betaine ABC transporter substrate-binding protein [Pseudomonas gingeri]NVZ60747.1 glycine betaine ABC transporter substrate-binding protein [Pseudomonas gingeri]NVZ75366.1 glycine betaine ABC transporter substrate-binding protein [Pseudomonas gingeri]
MPKLNATNSTRIANGAALAAPFFDHGTPKRRTVRLGVTDLSFHRATAALVAVVLQQMGFTVERSFALHEANFEQLRTGEIDMVASAWIPSSHGIYKARVEEVVLTRELGLHYQPYALWGVPDYVPQEELSTIEDLLQPQVLARICTTIQGIGPGAGITRFSLRMMDDYGLKAAGYSFRTGTQDECIAAFEDLVDAQRWGVVPLWQPQFLHHRHRIRDLKDPKGLLGEIDKAVLLARTDRLDIFTDAELDVLDNIRLSNAIVAELDYAINRQGKSPDQAAHDWLEAHPEALLKWKAPLF